jgi:hypothetical protein
LLPTCKSHTDQSARPLEPAQMREIDGYRAGAGSATWLVDARG